MSAELVAEYAQAEELQTRHIVCEYRALSDGIFCIAACPDVPTCARKGVVPEWDDDPCENCPFPEIGCPCGVKTNRRRKLAYEAWQNKRAAAPAPIVECPICGGIGKVRRNGWNLCEVCRKRNQKYSQGRTCSVCHRPIGNYGKSGKCISCIRKLHVPGAIIIREG